jgi:hypothetical protein
MTKMCRFVLIACALAASSAHAQERDFPQLDLTLYGGALLSSAGDSQVDAVGLSLGLSAFARLNDLFGLGLQIEHDELGWRALGARNGSATPGSAFPNDEGSIAHDLVLLAARLYFLRLGPADLTAQLALGYGAVTYVPDHPDCSISDDFAAQLALGAEWRLTRALGVHTSVAAWPFGWGLGCDELSYEGMPPNAPYLNLALGARVGLTTVWE